MTFTLDATHDTQRKSWVESANAAGSDFPIQNLPFGRFRAAGSSEAFRIGVAIGDQILDLRAAGLIATDDMNALMAAAPAERQALRLKISDGLAAGSPQQAAWAQALLPQAQAEYTVPCKVGDYTDFYTGIHHATTIGKLFRPDQPLMPNYKWVPIGYHGRASSIVVSGQSFKRPQGQTKAPDATEPSFGPCKRLDYELELGFYVGQGNALGESIGIDQAEAHLFGVGLFNDWSARDLQAWEYQPLGPFLAKNFASTVSPWIVTMEALAPFRAPFTRPEGDPQPLPYLDGAVNRAQGQLDITLEVYVQTAKMRAEGAEPARLTHGRVKDAAYWTAAQLVAHHTVNGCNLQPGDLLGSGTLSGPTLDAAGSLMELTLGGKQAITLPNGEQRTFLQDGDTLILRGWCEREGAVRIGLGEASGTVLA
ncbi:fumarylacetoacetase [Xenophilus arseniciresistens]|uniref:fumarylacetoacetase n=1 Tax=Xenophilus arseniciresistens TaxID=1283306 RepID=A0AAE3NA57_9BURK|nr:fumarylacetoacetase [Xenophilus arseniciresistens]MDA7418540.1 fumarylacetoacetase [Xenophilus arseniciresistens]